MYARMESLGLPVDLEHFIAFQADLETALEEKTQEIQRDFPTLEPGSAKQVSKVLYQQLGLQGGKKTKTGMISTNDKFLEAMVGQHPLVQQIIDWREIDTSCVGVSPRSCLTAGCGGTILRTKWRGG